MNVEYVKPIMKTVVAVVRIARAMPATGVPVGNVTRTSAAAIKMEIVRAMLVKNVNAAVAAKSMGGAEKSERSPLKSRRK
jgi:hypothetical protein